MKTLKDYINEQMENEEFRNEYATGTKFYS